MVESFMFAGGVAFEPHYTNLRKWLSKVIKLILVIDDVYDVYGSLEELECFTVGLVEACCSPDPIICNPSMCFL